MLLFMQFKRRENEFSALLQGDYCGSSGMVHNCLIQQQVRFTHITYYPVYIKNVYRGLKKFISLLFPLSHPPTQDSRAINQNGFYLPGFQ